MGLDEAGRGSLIGSMVIAGVVIRECDMQKLIEIGVRDSKKLSRSKRERIFQELLSIARLVIVRVVSPYEIDRSNLNKLEIETFRNIIETACISLGECPHKIYTDAVEPEKKTEEILKRIRGVKEVHVEAEAEEKHLIVAAASIIAKVLRDWHLDSIRRTLGDIGSGYPSDIRTLKWLEENKELARELGGYLIRRKWSTYKKQIQEITPTLDKYMLHEKIKNNKNKEENTQPEDRTPKNHLPS
ncbi:MAG: ribonuclease HII [Sulfolobales archaeon]